MIMSPKGSSVNIARNVATYFRSKVMPVYWPAEVALPGFHQQKSKLIGLLRRKAEDLAKSELARKLKVVNGYAVLEMAPPKSNEIEQIKADIVLFTEFMKTGCYKHLTIKQAFLMFLVGLEISLWFYLGETIGKFHIIGYNV